MNKIILVANICNDLEIKESGQSKILSFNVAVKRKFKNKNEEYESDFIRVKCFNQKAIFVEKYFKKGSKIVIEGHLQSSTWEDEQGIKHYSLDVIADEVEFCGPKKENNNEPENVNQAELDVNVVDNGSNSDLPF